MSLVPRPCSEHCRHHPEGHPVVGTLFILAVAIILVLASGLVRLPIP